jgi:hypothetical protein
MTAWPGRNPTAAVAPAISTMRGRNSSTSAKICHPTESTAPTGLMIQCCAVDGERRKQHHGQVFGRENTGPMIVANAPYRVKSYHCTALSRHSGRTAVRVADACHDCCRYRRGET